MAVAGAVAPRVVVRPPNVPAPPPISLLTQNNVVEDDGDAIGDAGRGRWEGGGGTIWLDPQRQFDDNQVWQSWPGTGAASGTKLSRSSGGDASASSISSSDPGTVQLPILANLVLDQGILSRFALDSQIEGGIDSQMERALGAVLPRLIERELWTSAEAVHAGWPNQFRLKTTGVVSTLTTTAVPYGRALALAEQAAADQRFTDQFGGAFLHMTPALFSLLATRVANLVRSPSGRQVTTLAGSVLVPEAGATGTWAEAAGAIVDDRAGGAPVGDNAATGWLFVTPPVRIRLGVSGVEVFESSPNLATNDVLILGERAFVIEASVISGRFTSIGIPVDYTTSGV